MFLSEVRCTRLQRAIRTALIALALSTTRSAVAQPAPTPEEVQQAQVRWNEGKAYFDSGNFEAARVAFKQAYTVFPHAAFLQNLGEAEFRTGRNVEAARHFTAFLRASSSGSPSQRELAKKSLVKAAEKLGAIVVTTNVDDAEIRVDDEVLGRSPLGSLAWYVEPGRHLVTARKEGYLDGSERIEVPVGTTKSVMVRVQRVVGGTSESPPAEETKDHRPPASPHPSPNAPLAASTAASSADSGDRPALHPRTIVLLSGATLTVGSLVVGTAFALKTGADSARIQDTQARLAEPDACAEPAPASLMGLCQSLANDNATRHTDRTVRNIALISAGAFGAATVVTHLLWRPRSSTTMSLAPALSAESQGLLVWGRF
jgi:hypothetical protein